MKKQTLPRLGASALVLGLAATMAFAAGQNPKNVGAQSGSGLVSAQLPAVSAWTKDRTEPLTWTETGADGAAGTGYITTAVTEQQAANSWYDWQGRSAATNADFTNHWVVETQLVVTEEMVGTQNEGDGIRSSLWIKVDGDTTVADANLDWSIVQFCNDGTQIAWQTWDGQTGQWNNIEGVSPSVGTHTLKTEYMDGTIYQYIDDSLVNQYGLADIYGYGFISAPSGVIIQNRTFGKSYATTWKIPTVQYTEGYDANTIFVGGEDSAYTDLASAVNDADAGATIVLGKDITLTKSIQLTQGTDVTIDGNGHALRFAFEGVNSPAVFGSNASAIPSNVNLTVKNAVLENTNGSQQGYGVLTAINATNTNITLDNCTFKNLYSGAYINPIKSADNQGVLSIIGCTYENTKYGFSADDVTEGAYMDAMGVRFEGNSGIEQVEEVWNNVVYVNGVSQGTGKDALVNAVANAETGSTILLAPGEYDGDVFFHGKDITVRAMYPAYQGGVKEAEENLSKFYGTFNTSNGSDPSNFNAEQTVVIDGVALAGDGLKIGNCNYNAVGNLEVRHCTMEFGANETTNNQWNLYNYFVKVSGARNGNYASVVIEDNHVSGTPVTNVYPIQAWQVDNVVIRNNVMELTNAADHEAVGVSSMATDAKVEIAGNIISGAGRAISVTTWYVGGTTEDNLGTFAGDIVIEDNELNCVDSTVFQSPIFVGSGDGENHGNMGGTLSVSGNTNNGTNVAAEIGWNEGQTKAYVATLVDDGAVVEQYVGQTQITLPKYDKTGYEFLGWLADGQVYAAGESVTITKDMSFVAQWKEVIEVVPTEEPQPTQQPSAQPTQQPSAQPTQQPSAQPSAQPSQKPAGEKPQTGDTMNLTIWVALLAICLGTLTSVSVYTKKRG